MKIRNGFVSNSSSSSFVLFGNPINIDEVLDKDVEKGKIVVRGRYLGDGEDVFHLTPEMFDFIREEWEGFSKELGFFWCWYLIESGSTIDLRTVPQNCNVYSIEVDYHASNSPAILKENYMTTLSDNLDQ